MAENLITYCVVHQPRRIKLPAQVIPMRTKPGDMAPYLLDDVMNRRYFDKVARWCYHPACQMFLDMLDDGYKLGLGFSLSFLWQLRRWDAQLAESFRRLVAHPNCELVGVEPYHSFAFAIDIKLFQREMKRGKDYAEEFFDKEIRVTDTTEMVMNNEVYYALLQSGYRAGMLDGRKWVLDWREPTHLYGTASATSRSSAATTSCRTTSAIASATRPGRAIPSAPTPMPSTCAGLGRLRLYRLGLRDVRRAPQRRHGHLRFHAGAAHPAEDSRESAASPRAKPSTSSATASLPDLPLPEFGTTWAGSGGMEFFLGNTSQQAIFRLMHSVLHKARLTGNRTLIDLALWLLQSDNLHLIQWAGRSGSEAEVSAYFTPDEWWDLGPDRILTEQQRVYTNFLRAMDEYV